MATLDARNQQILAKRVTMLDKIEGPRVGDYILFADGVTRRISHIWDFGDGDPTSVQTSDGGSFYIGEGHVSFSGSLFGGAPGPSLTLTAERRPGSVWFFDHDVPGAGQGVPATVEFRVYASTVVAPT